MVNNVVLIGRLTKDVELRKTTSGNSVVSFTLAVNRDFVKEGQQETDFIQCQAWNKTAELMNEYLHKGSMIAVQGRISVREYDNPKTQSRQWITEVIVNNIQFLEPKTQTQPKPKTVKAEQEQPIPDISSDDLPF